MEIVKKLFSLRNPAAKDRLPGARLSLAGLADEALAVRAGAGSGQHFEVLVRRYSAAIYRFSLRFSGNPAAAEEIAQETFIKVFQALPTARQGLPFKPWLYKIASNTAISYYRKTKMNSLNAPLEAAEAMAGKIDVAGAVANRVDAQAAISRLAPDYRQVVILRAIEEFSFGEIAAILEIPEPTARTRYKRAKDSLKVFLADS